MFRIVAAICLELVAVGACAWWCLDQSVDVERLVLVAFIGAAGGFALRPRRRNLSTGIWSIFISLNAVLILFAWPIGVASTTSQSGENVLLYCHDKAKSVGAVTEVTDSILPPGQFCRFSTGEVVNIASPGVVITAWVTLVLLGVAHFALWRTYLVDRDDLTASRFVEQLP